MKIARIALLVALFLTTAAVSSQAWVVRDTITEVATSPPNDLFAVRKIRHNEQLNEEETVWEIFSDDEPNRALMVVGFQDGKFAHHWEWKEGLAAYPRRNDLAPIFDKVTANNDDPPPFPEEDFRALLKKRMKMAPAESATNCGASLTEDATGYTLTVGSVTRKLGWVHANNNGSAFKRAVDRCYSGPAGVVGVVIKMSGTVTAPAGEGTPKKSYPNFSTETFVWMNEPPKS